MRKPSIVLVAELRVRDRTKLLRYASAVQPVMGAYGGRIVATSAAGVRTVEGDALEGVLVVHEWETEAGFEEFWNSAEYEPLKQLRREACDARIHLLSGLEP